MTTSPLLLAGTLFLSPANPVELPSTANQLWFSDAKKIEATGLGAKRLILKAKDEGILFASGLGLRAPAPHRIHSLSDEDFRALQKCPQAPVRSEVHPLEVIAPTPLDFSSLAACNFGRLALSDAVREAWNPHLLAQENELSRHGFQILQRNWRQGQRELLLSARSPEENREARRVLGPWAPFFILRQSELPRPGRTLVFLLTLFEFSRNKAQALGVRWPEALQIKSLDGRSWNVAQGEEGFVLGADFGESLGVGKVLAQPQIRTKPGEKAIFQSGGEIPIRQSSPHSSSTSWKNYGLLLSLETDGGIPTAAPEISLSFKVELSEPDPATALDGVPGMTVRRLESRFDLRVNENTVLTTMIQSRSGARQNGLLGWGRLPLLGLLFADRHDSEDNSELCFSIRPTWEEIPVTKKEYGWL